MTPEMSEMKTWSMPTGPWNSMSGHKIKSIHVIAVSSATTWTKLANAEKTDQKLLKTLYS